MPPSQGRDTFDPGRVIENVTVPLGTPDPPSVPLGAAVAVNDIGVPWPMEQMSPEQVPADGTRATVSAAALTDWCPMPELDRYWASPEYAPVMA